MKYTEEQITWLKDNYQNYNSYRLIQTEFNELFGDSRSLMAIQQVMTKKLGLYLETDKKSEQFTYDEEQWIIKNFDRYSTYDNLTADFNSIFHRSKPVSAIREKCTKRLLLTGMDNTGQFRKGNMKEQCPIGTIRKTASGSYIKVKDSQYSYMSGYEEPYWLPLQKKIWQDHFGKVPEGKMVIFLDGNRDNVDIDNLYCIDRKISAIMAKNRWFTNSKEHTLTAIKWCELFYVMKGETK